MDSAETTMPEEQLNTSQRDQFAMEMALRTLTKTNRPENLPSRLSNNLIGRCFAETFEEQPVDPSWPADLGSSPALCPTP